MSDQEKISSQNNPPTRAYREILLEEKRLEALNNFLSSPRQKTEIKPSERIILSLLYKVAENPYTISEKIATQRGIPFDKEHYVDTFFKECLDNYIEFGLPVGRKGRGEDERAMKSYFNQINEDRKEKPPTVMK